VIQDALKLTVYFGERDRAGRAFLADVLFDVYARHGLATSVLLRGAQGFGIKHRLQTDRLLTLSEDLPLVSVAVDARERIEAALLEVREIASHGLISLERARLMTERLERVDLPTGEHEAVKLTLYEGRGRRAGGRPAHVTAVDTLRRHGIEGATVLLGVDGTLHGERRRARFFASNDGVPLMLLAVGRGDRIASALPEVARLYREPIATFELVRVCKRDGVPLTGPRHLPEQDDAGLPIWQKLMVHAPEHARVSGHPLHVQLLRRLRETQAAGATVLRGVYGFHGDQGPFYDRLLQVRRRVPMTTVIVDTPAGIRRSWEIVDELTRETGLVTSELVPAGRATGPDIRKGTLRLASISRTFRDHGRDHGR
jgi:PII-like signaling protein